MSSDSITTFVDSTLSSYSIIIFVDSTLSTYSIITFVDLLLRFVRSPVKYVHFWDVYLSVCPSVHMFCVLVPL